MADKPKDNKPATEFGEVKVIKNEPEPSPESGPAKKPEQGKAETDVEG